MVTQKEWFKLNISAGDVKQLAYNLGADLCGIAPVERFQQAPKGFHPCDVLLECRSVIVFGATWPESSLKQGSAIYTMARDLMADKLDLVAKALALELRGEGAIVSPISSMNDCRWDEDGRRRGPISLKHAAELAGLGRIGRNTLLVNQRYGNMIWLGAVLTDSELACDAVVDRQFCPAGCRACQEACPANAISSDRLFSQRDCHKWAYKYPDGKETIVCHLCRSACPLCLGIRE